MISMSPDVISILLVLYPLIFVLVAWYLLRKRKSKRELYFILGMLTMIGVYVFLPDPSLIQKLYVEGSDYGPILLYGTISAIFLLVAIFFFRKHLEQ